jgi:RHS repeat-associated protein
LHQLKLDGATISTRTYDAGRRQTGETLGNGVTETRTYSNDNLLTGISYGGTGAAIGNMTYTWDTNKNKTSESITGVMSGYGFTNAGTTYDDEDRLTGYARANGSLNQSWNLTTVGDCTSVTTNGTAQTRTHGPTHELLSAGGQSVSTDVKGNTTVLPSSLTTQSSPLLLAYDFDNKMTSADVGNDGSADVEYKYDALGRRVARVGNSSSYVYVQSDQQTIADYGVGDAPSSPLYRYVYASYIDEPVVRKGAGTGGTIHYYHRNQQYSITAVTTSTGVVAERYAYSAYGQPTILDTTGSPIGNQQSQIANRYMYTGREWDGTIGLYHFRARWMSALTGRFLTRDPIGLRGSEDSLYEYVEGKVFGLLDPSGMVPISCRCKCGQSQVTDIRTDCQGDGDTCCSKACDTTLTFFVYKSEPGEDGGLDGSIRKRCPGVKDGQFIDPDPGRGRWFIEHLRCHYDGVWDLEPGLPKHPPMPPLECDQDLCIVECELAALLCAAQCARVPAPQAKIACGVACGSVFVGCKYGCKLLCKK